MHATDIYRAEYIHILGGRYYTSYRGKLMKTFHVWLRLVAPRQLHINAWDELEGVAYIVEK